jgi:formylglycine-generating enzyme required for sulfatase activity
VIVAAFVEASRMFSATWFRMAGLLLALALALAGVESNGDQKIEKEEADPEPGKQNSIGMKFVLVKKGKFTMGSPREEREFNAENQHEVEITKDFYLGKYEVTQKQYKDIMGENPSWFRKGGGGEAAVKNLNTDDFPVEQVTYENALLFLEKLNEREKKTLRGKKYRLPSEAQWEYACRGGPVTSTKPFHFKKPSDSFSSGDGNFDGRTPYGDAKKGKYLGRTCKVGSYAPNRLGLYDLHGNVWEWCSDWHDSNYYQNSPKQDPEGPAETALRVIRGGSWSHFGQLCRAATRHRSAPTSQGSNIGFRVALVSGE